MTLEETFALYERMTNTTDFDQVSPLIAEDAVYWFADGRFEGIAANQEAFEKTWNTIKDEKYQLTNIRWIGVSDNLAVCTYDFHSQGLVSGRPFSASGKGTNVFLSVDGQWKIVHEHLSKG